MKYKNVTLEVVVVCNQLACTSIFITKSPKRTDVLSATRSNNERLRRRRRRLNDAGAATFHDNSDVLPPPMTDLTFLSIRLQLLQ